MKKTDDVRELALREYERDKSIPAVLEALKKEGIEVSERSLHKWKKQDGWETCIKRKSQLEQWLLNVLISAIEDCHKRLGSSKRMDSQSAFALVCLVRAACELKKSGKVTDIKEMQRLANEILETEYGIIRSEPDVKET